LNTRYLMPVGKIEDMQDHSIPLIPPLPTPEPVPGVRQAIVAAMSASVSVLAAGFGAAQQTQRKESQSSVVTETDFRSEAVILSTLRPLFPDHGFLAEETGLIPGAGRWTWIIDPLDGTANFAAGIPWFATMLALVEEGQVLAAAISLPAMGEHYYAERGAGAYLNGRRISVSPEPELANLLAAYAFDWCEDAGRTRQQALALGRLVAAVRNVRAANCVLEDCFVASGRLGAAVNQSMKIWDVAPAVLLVMEAGGIITDIHGRPHHLHATEESAGQIHTRVSATPAVHAEVLQILRDA
jgi:myo-inositol-1(or 4)-monophosphatase